MVCFGHLGTKMNNSKIQTAPDVYWTWDDQAAQEILSGERRSKIYQEVYDKKLKWYHDKTTWVSFCFGILARLVCNIARQVIY